LNQILIGCGWIITSILLTGYLGFVLESLREKRLRPVFVTSLLFIPFLSILLILLLVPFNGHILILTIILGIILFTFLIILMPFGKKPVLKVTESQEKLDERDALFHRFTSLKPDMPEFEMYYRQHPENREFDDMVRKLPSFEEEGSQNYHPLVSLYQKALFDQIEVLAENLDAPSSPEVKEVSTDEITERLKGFSRYLGADLVGSTRLNPAYVYSHVARDSDKWGEPVSLDHQYALVFAIEMNYEMVKHAPWSEVITESAFKYYEAAKISTVVSQYIKLLGYDARAHVDQNYRVMCVPVAVDAGLGELGRLGLLMTPEYGPRVRLSVVTTNLPLLQDQPQYFGVQDFCEICKKCATNCPSGSIDSGEKKLYKGVEKWQSNMDTCYRFWRLQGSDCAVCLKVCPYSHPGTFFHNLIRSLIKKNPLNRRLALWGDNLLYGKYPREKASQEKWHKRN
jgi:ferredoxin